MALEVHVSGPGLDVTRRLEQDEPALVIGRDTDCAIPLPDPERNVSRRHLSVWNEGEQLHFHVLSVVNGVQTGEGELPPGARGVLAPGDAITLATFRVSASPVVPVAPPPPEFLDTWARLQHEAEQLGADEDPTVQGMPEEDPFGDWGFNSTFGAEHALPAEGMAAATDLKPFLAGLGLDPAAQPPLTQAELETIGRVARLALQALLQASQAAAQSRQEARAEDHTVAEKRDLNPLRMDTTIETRLYYLFGGATAAAGFMPPDRAVAQLAADLVAHEQAMGQAVQETVRAVLGEFEPEALKKRLLGGGARLFESARAWEAFAKDHADRMAAEGEWVRQLLDRHFARAYARALLRAKRNTGGRPGS